MIVTRFKFLFIKITETRFNLILIWVTTTTPLTNPYATRLQRTFTLLEQQTFYMVKHSENTQDSNHKCSPL